MLRFSMYIRMIARALLKRKSRVIIALASLVIGTGVISGMLSVYYDINNKMSKELRSYGANFVMTPKQGNLLGENKIEEVVAGINPEKIEGYSPYLYHIGTVGSKKLVIVGLWLDQIWKVTPYWQITGTDRLARDDRKSVLIGDNVAAKLNLAAGDTVALKDEISGNGVELTVKGIVKTGSTEDNQVFVNLPVAQNLFEVNNQANLVYLSILGKSDELSQSLEKINRVISDVEFRPIKQIAKSEGIILEKIKSLVYLVILIILLSTLLCVATTMMTMVLERRKEIGLRKALGAQNRSIIFEFLGEGLALGLVGGLTGTVLGIGLAQVIGQSVFQSYISFRIEVTLFVILMSLFVTAIASLIPVKTAVHVEPALVLKGE
ncbi:MAG: FtsX-like permease family protein [Thermincola sp.]|nr:FtsX-like permease family protein [Thermincola sp.]MDT3702310.1 FtsX-like permease family protein [Thermincola sp.]